MAGSRSPEDGADVSVLADLDVTTHAPPRRAPERAAGQQPALTIAAHPVADRVGHRLLLGALSHRGEVTIARGAPEFFPPGSALGLPLADPFVSRKPLTLSFGPGGEIHLHLPDGNMEVRADGRPVERGATFSAAEVARGATIELSGRVILVLHLAAEVETIGAADASMIGRSLGMEAVRRSIARVADLDVPVLVRGETGSGKELVARALHDGSRRRAGPFVSVNVGAMPKELAAAELFGAVRGAYTGAASDREGLFRIARGGTLFLDEVGEAPPEVQVMLLRVLETGELYPVGGDTPVKLDTRVIAATDANLEAQISAGRFKAPLYHRLAGYEVRVPPLRERREDIGPLFIHFARAELAATGEADRLRPRDAQSEPWLPATVASLLVRYAWPGNVRQLRNLTRQIVIGSRGLASVVLDRQLAAELEAGRDERPGSSPFKPAAVLGAHKTGCDPLPAVVVPTPAPKGDLTPRRRPADISEAELREALRVASWDLQATADRLGITRSSIYDLIEKYPDIRTAGDLDAAEIQRCFEASEGDLDVMVERLQVSKRALGRRLRELGLRRP